MVKETQNELKEKKLSQPRSFFFFCNMEVQKHHIHISLFNENTLMPNLAFLYQLIFFSTLHCFPKTLSFYSNLVIEM